ncbi:MAG: hypothetical protein IPK19_09170 [Chloroflexi bacterium]|nr:hypothetical protein [Chloroflexota bacterium]
MAWRIQLTEGTIKRLDILSGRPSLLAAWLRTDQVVFLDLQSGVQKNQITLEAQDFNQRSTLFWRAFLETLRAPNNVYLPHVRLKGGSIYSSSDGQKRLYYAGGRDLFLEIDKQETRLDTTPLAPAQMPTTAQAPSDSSKSESAPPEVFVSVGMDRAFGLTAALDGRANLTLFSERTRIGTFPTGLTITEDFRPILLVTKGSSAVIISDGQRLVALDSTGKIRAQVELYFTLGAMACSSDGRRLVLSDMESNVVRVYSGVDLRPTHQRFAVDLLAESKRAQLLAMPEAGRSAVGALAINSKGALAFAVAGTLCVTSLARMKVVPRSQVF